MLIFSSSANESEQVLREVQLAVDARLHIVQFRIDRVSLNDDLKFYLGTPHWLDGSNPPVSSELARLTAAVAKLLKIEQSAPLVATSAIPSHAETDGDENVTEATLFSATITLNSPIGEKQEFFRRLQPFIAHFVGEKADDIVSSMQEREQIMSTGGGFGLASPHSYKPYLKRFVVGVVWIPEGCDWDSADGRPVHLVLLYIGGGQARTRQALAVMGRAHKCAAGILARRSGQEVNETLVDEVLKSVTAALSEAGLRVGVMKFD